MSWLGLGLFCARPPMELIRPPSNMRDPPRVSPSASKLAYHPVLTKPGWVCCCGTIGTTAKDEEEEKDAQRLTP